MGFLTIMQPPVISGYELLECRGRGASGWVWRGVWNGDFACAVKVLERGGWHPQYLSWCLEELREAGGRPDILPVYSYDLEHDPPHLSMALLPEGSVSFEVLTARLPIHESWMLLEDLARTLAWLHARGIVHTALSGGNVFVTAGPAAEPQILVSDIGQGWLDGGPTEHLHRQAAYMAPEVWQSGRALLESGEAHGRDVFAFGVMAWRLLHGSWPRGPLVFDSLLGALDEEVKLEAPVFAEWLAGEPLQAWPVPAENEGVAQRRRIVERCLATDPAERFADMQEVAAALADCLLVDGSPRPGQEPVAPAGKAARRERGRKRRRAAEPASETPARPEAAPAPVAAPDKTTAAPVSAAPPVEVDPAAVFREEAESALPVAAVSEVEVEAPFVADGPAPAKARRFALPPQILSGILTAARERMAGGWGRAAVWPAVAGAALLAAAGMTAWGAKQRSARNDAEALLAKLGGDTAGTTAALERARAEADAARLEARNAEARLGAAGRAEVTSLVSKLLDSRPSDPVTLDAWRIAIRPVAVEAAELFKEAALTPTDRRGALLLARLHAALGDDAAALPILEKLSRDLEEALLSAPAEAVPDLVKVQAGAEALTGSILMDGRRAADALPHLQAASRAFEKWLAEAPEDATVPGQFARNLLMEARALTTRGQTEEARTQLLRLPGLVASPEDKSCPPEDRFLFADARFELAALETDAEQAMARYKEGLDVLIAFDRDIDNRSIPCRMRMARSFFELGRLLSRSETPMEASVAYGESVKLYTELMKEQPETPLFKLNLAATYNEVATLIHTARPGAAGAKEALDYQNFSITFLKNLNDSAPLDNGIRRTLAQSLVLNGELQEAAGDDATAMARQKEAVTLTAELVGDATLSENERRECRRLSARAWTSAATIHERAGRRQDAVAAFTKADSEWTAAPPETVAEKALAAMVRERLAKVKPPA